MDNWVQLEDSCVNIVLPTSRMAIWILHLIKIAVKLCKQKYLLVTHSSIRNSKYFEPALI